VQHKQQHKSPPSARSSNSLTIGSPTTLQPYLHLHAFGLKVRLGNLQLAFPIIPPAISSSFVAVAMFADNPSSRRICKF
jgi:hypothetical protein